MRLSTSIAVSAGIAALCLVSAGCSTTGDSKLERMAYPTTQKKVSVWYDGFSGKGSQEMQGYFTDELMASGAFTLALAPESAGIRLRCQSGQTSQGRSSQGGDFAIAGTRVDLGGSKSLWKLTFAIQEMGSPTGGSPIGMTLSDQVSASAMDIGGSHQGTRGSTAGTAPSPDVEEAMKNLANNMAVRLIKALKARGQL